MRPGKCGACLRRNLARCRKSGFLGEILGRVPARCVGTWLIILFRAAGGCFSHKSHFLSSNTVDYVSLAARKVKHITLQSVGEKTNPEKTSKKSKYFLKADRTRAYLKDFLISSRSPGDIEVFGEERGLTYKPLYIE